MKVVVMGMYDQSVMSFRKNVRNVRNLVANKRDSSSLHLSQSKKNFIPKKNLSHHNKKNTPSQQKV